MKDYEECPISTVPTVWFSSPGGHYIGTTLTAGARRLGARRVGLHHTLYGSCRGGHDTENAILSLTFINTHSTHIQRARTLYHVTL